MARVRRLGKHSQFHRVRSLRQALWLAPTARPHKFRNSLCWPLVRFRRLRILLFPFQRHRSLVSQRLPRPTRRLLTTSHRASLLLLVTRPRFHQRWIRPLATLKAASFIAAPLAGLRCRQALLAAFCPRMALVQIRHGFPLVERVRLRAFRQARA